MNRIGRSSAMKTYEEVELHEKTAFKICVKLISDKDSDFMIAPMSQKRYIINEKLNLFIILDYDRVEITNHIFHYDVKLSKRDTERILYLYDTETEKRRSNTEMKVKENIKTTLVKVLDAINKQTEKND
jgi:hypothetical protein